MKDSPGMIARAVFFGNRLFFRNYAKVIMQEIILVFLQDFKLFKF